LKRVLIITYYWPPSGGAGVQRWLKFVKYLPQYGWDPIVLTVDPDKASYPQKDESLIEEINSDIKVFHTNTFEPYNLYKKISSNKETPYGGFVNSEKNNFKEKVLRWIRGNFFLPDPRKGWNRYAIKKAKELITQYSIEVVVTTSPPHSTQLIGLELKKKTGIKWVADLRDPWVDIYYFKQLYPSFIATGIHKNFERKVFKYADNIITVSPQLKRIFSNKAENISDKIKVIPNGFDEEDFADFYKLPANEKFTLSYVGTISEKYNIDGLISGILLLPESIKSNIKIQFIGKLSNDLYDLFSRAGLKDLVEVIGYVEHKKAIKYMCTSQLLLLIIPKVKDNEGILTGKMFEYLATQKPILYIGPTNGDAANIIAECESGDSCDYNDSVKIKEVILKHFNSFSSKNVTPVINKEIAKYSRQNLTKIVAGILD